MGKGSQDRVTNLEEFRKNYEEIFGSREPKVWKPAEGDDPRRQEPPKEKSEAHENH